MYPQGVLSLYIHMSLAPSKKIQPPISNSSPTLFLSFSHPHQSPPSYSNCENRRKLVLHEQIPLSSFFRFNIFLLQCGRLKLWPMTMRLAVQRQHILVLAVFNKVMGFDCQMISTSMWDQHHLATSTFVLKRIRFTWEKRCQASAEQLSCLGTIWGWAASIGGPKSTVGGEWNINKLGGTFSMFVIVLVSDWEHLQRSCIDRLVGWLCAGGLMRIHNGLSSDWAGCESSAELLVDVCNDGDGGCDMRAKPLFDVCKGDDGNVVVIWWQLVSSILLE